MEQYDIDEIFSDLKERVDEGAFSRFLPVKIGDVWFSRGMESVTVVDVNSGEGIARSLPCTAKLAYTTPKFPFGELLFSINIS